MYKEANIFFFQNLLGFTDGLSYSTSQKSKETTKFHYPSSVPSQS